MFEQIDHFRYLGSMLYFNQADTAANIIVTLNEKRTITDNVFYLFVFTHVTTRQTVTVIYSQGDDESSYQDRYNKFTIDVAEKFAGKARGFWEYRVYKQTSSTNTVPANAGDLLEVGKMRLMPTDEFEFYMQDSDTTFIISDTTNG